MTKWEFIKSHYIDRHLKIFPIVNNEKTPLINAWQRDCSCDYFQVLYWFANCKDCNWGLPASENDLFILDLDVHDCNKNGIESFNAILNDIYDVGFTIDFNDMCDTLIQKTPSGGIHIIFKTDEDLKKVLNNSNVFKNYPGIDIRTSGYVVVEPSTINDNVYEFTNDKTIKEMDPSLKEFILNNVICKDDVTKEPYKKPTSVECGDRDNQLFSYIHNLYYKTTLDFDEILCLALHFNDTILEKPFSDKVVTYKVKKCFEKTRQKYIFIKLSDD